MAKHASTHEWILAIRMRQLGDVMATLEALRALREYNEHRRIIFVADRHFHPVIERLDFIDRLLPSPPDNPAQWLRYVRDVRALRPAGAVDFHGNARSALLALASGAPIRAGFAVRGRRHAYTRIEPRVKRVDGQVVPRNSVDSALDLARHLGTAPAPAGPIVLPVEDDVATRAYNLIVQAGVPARALAEGTVVGINPGRVYPAKEWPRDRFVALARRLVGDGRTVVVMWGPGEEASARLIAEQAGTGVVLAPPLSLAELPGALRSFALLVTIDSGLKHLAVCAGTPTVSLFGSTDPREWHLGSERDRYLWRGYSCSPCRRLDCPFGAPCMRFEPEEVMAAIRDLEAA